MMENENRTLVSEFVGVEENATPVKKEIDGVNLEDVDTKKELVTE